MDNTRTRRALACKYLHADRAVNFGNDRLARVVREGPVLLALLL